MIRHNTLRRILTALLLFMAVIYGQTAFATTKTVTYTITEVQQVSFSQQVTITRSGDTPFEDGSTTYTMSVSNSSLGDGSGHYSVMLADGFQLSLDWNANNYVIFQGNYIRPKATNGKITYTVSCQSYYYVTNLQMTGFEGTWYNTDYNSQWNFYQSQTSGYSLGAVTITYTDTPDISIFESDGDNAYKIKSYSDLRHLANYVNNGKNSCSGLTFRQTQNITGDNNYTPIGYHVDSNDRAYFEGTYDGQGHSVIGITVNRTGTNDRDDYYIGLFGYIYHAVVKDVVITNCTFTGYYYVGGVVGYNKQSTVHNCLVTSSVTINAGHNGALGHGGIVGANTGNSSVIIGCSSAAVVSSNGKTGCTRFGGITGYVSANTTVKSCLYTGTTVSGSSNIGAIIGYNDGGYKHFYNNYYTSGSQGGINGNDEDGVRRARIVTLGAHVAIADNETVYAVSGLTAIGMNSAPTALRTSTGTLYSAVGQTINFTNDYGTLSAGYLVVYTATNGGTFFDKQLTMPDADVSISATVNDVWGVTSSPAADGSQDYPYTITDTDGLMLLAKCVNGSDGYTADNGFSGKFFKLGNDIAYTYTSDWDNTSSDEINYIAVGDKNHSFNGTLDGDSNTISGIRYKESFPNDYRGLFGNVGNGGTIKNLTLADSRISGKDYTGGIAGITNAGAIIDNCAVADNVDIHYCHTNTNYHGGIVGENCGTIKDCTSRATLSTDNNLTVNYCGGIAGFNYSGGTIRDCIVWGTTMPQLTYSGAIVGNNSGSLTDNYYRSCIVGSQTSDIGCNGSDCNGARGVYSVTTPNDVIANGNKTIEIDGEDYFIAGITIVTLTNEPLATGYKYHYAYSYPGSSVIAVDGNSFLMPSSDTEVTTIICRTIEVTGYEDGSDKWAFIASPSSAPQPVVAVEGLLGETISYNPLTYNYDLYRLNPFSMLWENYHQHSDFTSLTNGKGYLYATKQTKTIAFPEPFNTADSQEVTLEQGWNLVGNPFEVDAYVNRAFYKMNAEGTGIEPVIANFDEYVPTAIPACTGIVVQAANANETVTFSKVAPTNAAANQGHITIALVQANTRDNSTLDKAIVNFNEGSQLGKFYFGEQNANIYIPRNHDDYAIINSDRRSDVDVHFKAKEFGRYTISFECENTDINGMKLIDLFTDDIIDLSENPSYTFTGSPADRAARFKLVFNNVSEENDIFAYQNGDDIIVDGEGELQVFDVMGRLVANQRINGVETIAKPEQAGIYILKMNEKTQKIIVR